MSLFFGNKIPNLDNPNIVVIGLGNPGPEYTYTRHNLGFICIEHLARTHQICFSNRNGPLRWGEGKISLAHATFTMMLVKPRTFMNHSGKAVKYLTDKFKLEISNILVIHDDIDIPIGKIKVRQNGGSGGHKGMQSIIDELNTTQIRRIRVGIGPENRDAVSTTEYVLGKFSKDEVESLNFVSVSVLNTTLCIADEGINTAMNKFN